MSIAKRVASLSCACVLFAGAALLAKDAATKAKQESRSASSDQSLDNELLKSLGSALLDDLDQPRTKAKPDAKKEPADPSLDDQLLDDLGGEDLGRRGESRDPLIRIERKMRAVEKRLNDGHVDRQTAEIQRQILDELAQFTAQCKAACKPGEGAKKSSKSSSGNKAGTTAGQAPVTTLPKDSSEQLQKRTTEFGDRRTATDSLKESWGQLPSRLRDQLPSPPSDAVLPKYEAMLKKYFQRLAEEDQAGP